MEYKEICEICNKHITAMAKELLNAGVPLPKVLETAKFMCLVIKKHLGDEKCTK